MCVAVKTDLFEPRDSYVVRNNMYYFQDFWNYPQQESRVAFERTHLTALSHPSIRSRSTLPTCCVASETVLKVSASLEGGSSASLEGGRLMSSACARLLKSAIAR